MSTQTSTPRSGTTASIPQDDHLPHLLSLKVMRLSRPQFATTLPVFYESTEPSPLVDGLDSLNISDLTACHPIQPSDIQIRDFGLSQMLKLPSAFGNIYLGETFSTLVSINNESPIPVHQVTTKIELQTSSQRFLLADQPPLNDLSPGANSDITVSHEIKELGVHILVCSVQYIGDGKKRHFRKFYKFQVSNPLAVKTKLNNMIDGRVFLEAQLQNVSAGPMFLERMKFEPSEHFGFESLNGRMDSEKTVFEDQFIHPQDVRQYLYMLSPHHADRISRTTNALGKLDIVWRSAMGDMGRLQTSQLTRKAPLLEDIEIQPFWVQQGAEVKVVLETPFRLGIRITNHSNENMKLVLSAIKTKMGSVLLSGLGSRQLGELGPSQSTETELEFFPLTPGLQRVGGLRVMDLLSGYTKDVDHVCDIFVLAHQQDTIESSLA
ncbi:hypothetical protein G6F62_001804 [Rhizopus arrhizus]|uniref:Trafficking protein particle complex subunit 13 n=1 Tax=Rhizopus oryzae TaxID=64495 RepID=A0A9P6XC99_RHIOR|nr:hypothetical protein G6F23_006552 [Rhizopus arrhizus]KAG0764979.1 hypothetical protein G6F24_004786 [Rhizopus arrhizus]KAG0916767.1 hypothetical protein G6F33_002108 [Rhizopus arrhizus]KAG0951496.1 hypothetical protein G6F32_004842 [Rhizopus arrhizus]KAG1292439.1 hypothetical protein G6F66_006968 [Rhizopus arrhizus]